MRKFNIWPVHRGLLIISLFFGLGSAHAFRITRVEHQADGKYAVEFESTTNQYFLLRGGTGIDDLPDVLGVAMGTNGTDRIENIIEAPEVQRYFFRLQQLPFDQPIDSDGDGLADPFESEVLGTDPANPDSDYDQIRDGEEFARGTNPLAVDTDLDGFSDVDEIALNTDPLDSGSKPQRHAHSSSVGYRNPLSVPHTPQRQVFSRLASYSNYELKASAASSWTVAAPTSYLNQRINSLSGATYARSNPISYLNQNVPRQSTDLRAHSSSISYLNVQVRETSPEKKSFSQTISYVNAQVNDSPRPQSVASGSVSFLNSTILQLLQKYRLSPIVTYENTP